MKHCLVLSLLLAPVLPAAPLNIGGGAAAPTLTLGQCSEGGRTATLNAILTTDKVSGATSDKAPSSAKLPIYLRTVFRAADGTLLTATSSRAPELQDPASSQNVILQVAFLSCSAPATGTLLAQTGSETPVSADISIRLAANPSCGTSPTWQGWKRLALGGPLVASVGIGLFMVGRLKGSLKRNMGGAQFDFGSSWATSATIGGATIGTIVGLTVFPDNGRYLSKSEYLALNAVIPVIAMLAPLVYNVFRREVPDPDTNNKTGLQLQGYVVTFLLAASVTCWSSLTQITVLTLGVNELNCSRYVPDYLAAAITALAALVCVGLLFYVGNTAILTARHQIAHVSKATKDAAAPTETPKLPNWNML